VCTQANGDEIMQFENHTIQLIADNGINFCLYLAAEVFKKIVMEKPLFMQMIDKGMHLASEIAADHFF